VIGSGAHRPPLAARAVRAGRPCADEGGFSLIEALIATIIAVLAVLGLAYTFSVGRGQVNRFEVARAAMGEAETQMERLTLLADSSPFSDSLAVGYVSPDFAFTYRGATLGTVGWRMEGYDDPDLPQDPDLRRLVVYVRWNIVTSDSVQFQQLLPLATP